MPAFRAIVVGDKVKYWRTATNYIMTSLGLIGEDETGSYIATTSTPNKLVKTGGDGKIDHGFLKIADQTEVDAGVDTEKIVTPATLAGRGSNALVLSNTIGTAIATSSNFGAAGAWTAYTQLDVASRIAQIYSGSLANVQAVSILSHLELAPTAGGANQRSSVAFSSNNSAAQDTVRHQRVLAGGAGADGLGACDTSELVVPITVSGPNAYLYYSVRREYGNWVAESWSAWITAVHLS